jgi:hypothetical protein
VIREHPLKVAVSNLDFRFNQQPPGVDHVLC